LRGRYAASTPHQRVLTSVPLRARLPAISPLADAVRRFTQLHTTSHSPQPRAQNPASVDAGSDTRKPLSSLVYLVCVVFGPLKSKPNQWQPVEAAMVRTVQRTDGRTDGACRTCQKGTRNRKARRITRGSYYVCANQDKTTQTRRHRQDWNDRKGHTR
jgi:hypothetical protein